MSAYSAHTDQELAALLKRADDAAFTEIYHRYKGVLYVHALKLLKDEDEAQDVVQDLYTTLWQKAADINLEIPLKAYLYKAVKNRIFDLFSRQKLSENYLAKFAEVVEQGVWVTDDKIREKELMAAIDEGMALMPEKMREVFEMSRLLNMSHKQIASELDISDKTVKTQVHNALKILRLKINSLLSILALFCLVLCLFFYRKKSYVNFSQIKSKIIYTQTLSQP
ncbi:RNA polymerase sigma-70 factor [Pedobacter heparinus]|uniref:RNA polymerase sigma factor n=1 Tax=Pedobacter heparinus TaxID=984 RepID=UPI00292E0CA6|nr:RNA polymerase sigma-70 factor [Pedobacter heparinus]